MKLKMMIYTMSILITRVQYIFVCWPWPWQFDQSKTITKKGSERCDKHPQYFCHLFIFYAEAEFWIFNGAIFEVELNHTNVTFFWTPLSNGDVLFGLPQCSLDSLGSSSAKVATLKLWTIISCAEATLSTSPINPGCVCWQQDLLLNVLADDDNRALIAHSALQLYIGWEPYLPASVTSPLSTVWCSGPYTSYIFCKDMILATCHHHLSEHCGAEVYKGQFLLNQTFQAMQWWI